MPRRSALSRFILRPLNRVTRRFSCNFDRSQDISDTRFGFYLSTTSVLAEWNVATSTFKNSLAVRVIFMLGYWSFSATVLI